MKAVDIASRWLEALVRSPIAEGDSQALDLIVTIACAATVIDARLEQIAEALAERRDGGA